MKVQFTSGILSVNLRWVVQQTRNWNSAMCTDYYQRLTLESWFSNLEQTPLNRSQQLPALYKRLIDEIKQN